MARSLAFWLDEPSGNPKIELHFNYWSLDSSQVEYLDIGVKLSMEGAYKSINFYLPFDTQKIGYVAELGEKVCSHDELLSAIFNSTVKNNATVDNDIHDITFSKGDSLRFFSQILKEEPKSPGGVQIKPLDEGDAKKGTTICFPADLLNIKNSTTNKEDIPTHGYFRFRIELNEEGKKSISHLYKPKDSWITNHFEKVEMVDFRVNEARNLPKKIQSKLQLDSHILAIHFFLIREADSEFKMSHDDFHRCRILEKDLWDNYLYLKDTTEKKTPDQMLIYHWKGGGATSTTNIDHFSAFAKFTRRHVRKRDILLAIIFIVLLGACGSHLSTWLWKISENNVECIED
ncbi:MAG: hypothetical protein GQ532_11960 [Methylomarinum sp.]|nr:hypothetical protein [Methylomarinum sp.]